MSKAIIIYAGWLGDFVWIIPMLKALRTRFESLSIVVSERQLPLANMLKGDLLDEVFADIPKQRAACAKKTRRAIRERGITTVIDIKGRAKTGLYIPWLAGLDLYMPSRENCHEFLASRLLHPFPKTLAPMDNSVHMVQLHTDIAESFGVKDFPNTFDIPFSEETVSAASVVLDRIKADGKRTVALNVGSAQFSKIWPASSFRRLAEALRSDLDCTPVVMGAKSFSDNQNYDASVSREQFADGEFVNLIEETPFEVDAYLMSKGCFDVYVGNDSFAGHMAGSASEVSPDQPGAIRADNGKHYTANKSVALFAPTNPIYCKPYDPTDQFSLIVKPADYPDTCVYDRVRHVCPLYESRKCYETNHCMKNITVEQVLEAVEKQLK